MLSAVANYEIFLIACSLFRPNQLQEGKSRDSFVSVGPPAQKAQNCLFNAGAESRQGNRAHQLIAQTHVKSFVLAITSSPPPNQQSQEACRTTEWTCRS